MESNITIKEQKKLEKEKKRLEKDKKKRERILDGSLFPIIISICAPIIVYQFFNSFYNLIDAAMVSKISSTSVSAVASLSQIKNLLSSLGAGISAGGGIIIARNFGAGNFNESRIKSNQLISLSTIIVALLLGICIPFSNFIMKITGVPSELIAIGTGYFIVEILSLAFVFYNSVFIAIQKAKGNTKLVLPLNIMLMVIKLILNVLFIYIMEVDSITWVAFATLVGQIAMFVVLLVMMLYKEAVFKINFKEMKLNKKAVKEIIAISLPIFLGKFIFSFGKVSVNAMCKSYGPLVVGALGVSNNLCGIVTSPTNSFEEGTSTIVSQNLGNRNMKRAFEAFWRSMVLSVSIGIIGYILIRFTFQDALINLFNQNKDDVNAAELMALIKEINKYDSLSILALAVSSSVLGLLYGFGQTKLTMILNISRAFVFRIPLLWYFMTFHKDLGATACGISMGVSNICITISSLIALGIFVLKIKKTGYNGMKLGESNENRTSCA